MSDISKDVNAITDEIKEMMNMKNKDTAAEYPPDEEFDYQAQKPVERKVLTPNNQFDSLRQGQSIPLDTRFPRKSQEAAAIDELLMGVNRSQGYYLKLYKEVRPGEPELKLKIDNYEAWSDLEWEVTKLIREYTKSDPDKWGSGKYQIIVWHDKGMRGIKRPPMNFLVDAQESKAANLRQELQDMLTKTGEMSKAGSSTSIEDMAKLMEVMSKINPPANHTQQTEIIAKAVETGQKLAVDKQAQTDASNNGLLGLVGTLLNRPVPSTDNGMGVIMPLILAMMSAQQKAATDTMTMMMAMMQNKPEQKQDNHLLEMITALGGLGLIGGDKAKNNPIQSLIELRKAGLIPEQKEGNNLTELLKQFALLQSFSGGLGSSAPEESGGILGTLVKGLTPKIPEMVGNVTGAISKVVELNKIKLQNQAALAQQAIRQNPANRQQRRQVQRQPRQIQAPQNAVQHNTPTNNEILGNTVQNADNRLGLGETEQVQTISAEQNTEQPSTEVIVQHNDGSVHYADQEITEGMDMNLLVKIYSAKLYKYVMNLDYAKFDEILTITRKLSNNEPLIEDGIKLGTITLEQLMQMVIELDKTAWKSESMSNLQKYCEELIAYIKKSGDLLIAKCNMCETEYSFESQEEFDSSDKKCEEVNKDTDLQCEGTLKLQ